MEKLIRPMANILLVEDDEISMFLVTRNLRKNYFEKIDYTDNGLEAVSYLTKKCPDLIFLDLNMPVMSGFEFLDYISKHKAYSNISVIILTSSIRPEDLKKGMSYPQVIDYLEKPLNSQKLELALEKFINHFKNKTLSF